MIVGCKRNESIAAIAESKPFRFRFPRKGAESCEGTSFFFFPTHTGIKIFIRHSNLNLRVFCMLNFMRFLILKNASLYVERRCVLHCFFTILCQQKNTLKYPRFRNNKISQAHTGGEDSLFICPNGSAAGQEGFGESRGELGHVCCSNLKSPKDVLVGLEG